MFRKGIFSDVKINDSSNFNSVLSSPPQAESTQIENATKSSGKLTPKRRVVSVLQNSKGITKMSNSSPVLSRKIDPQVFTDVQSRGLASRIVKYHELNKSNERPTIRSNYGKPGEFPIVNLNTKKELPYVVKRNLSTKNPPVRIAPPDKTTTNLNYRSSMLRSSGILFKNDIEPFGPTTSNPVNARTRSVLDELTEISRKRINNEELKIDSVKKTCIEGTGAADQPDGSYIGLGGTGLSGNKKRQRDTSFSTSPTSISPTKLDNLHLNKKNCLLNKKPSMIKNNDILSSLSSSMIFPNVKLNRNSKNTVNHSNNYNTNNVFIQSIERQYHNRLPSFDAQPNYASKTNLIHTSSSPSVPTTKNISMEFDTTVSNILASRSEPEKPASRKLLLFNRPEVHQQRVVKVDHSSEDSTVNFVKPKQIIDNNLIIEPNKINENSLVKRKSNLTGIERSKLAMMLEYLKSDDEDDEEKFKDEIDNKSDELATFIKPNLPNSVSSITSVASSLSQEPLTSSTKQILAPALPQLFGTLDKSATVTTTSVVPVMTTKVETSSSIIGTDNTSLASVPKPISVPSMSTIESKPEVACKETTTSSMIGGFSFPIITSVNSSESSTTITDSVSTIISGSKTTSSLPVDGKIKTIETPISFSPFSKTESQLQANQTFSFFNKPSVGVTENKIPAPQPNLPSMNFSSHQPVLPTSLINFSSPQKNLTAIPKATNEEMPFNAIGQSPPRSDLNQTFGGVVIPTTTVTETVSIHPVTTVSSKFPFTTNNANFTEASTIANLFMFNPPGYSTSDFNNVNKSKVQTTMSTVQPVQSTQTNEPQISFMQNTQVPNPSVSVVKPFSFSNSSVSAAPVVTETSVFNGGSGAQINKNMFGNFPTTTKTSSAFTFGSNVAPSTQQTNTFGNNVAPSAQQANAFGNTQATSNQQNTIFGNLQVPSSQSNNVFGNTQLPPASSNNSETTLFNFKTVNANNINTNQPVSNAETSSNVFKSLTASTTNPNSFGSPGSINVFGGGGVQNNSDIFGSGMSNKATKSGSGVFNFTTTTTQANPTLPSSTFSFAEVNKTQPTSSNANVFGSSNTEQPKPFSFGGGNNINKIPTFGSNNEPSKSFAFGQADPAISSHISNKPPAFGSPIYGNNSNTDTSKLETSKSAFAFGSSNSTQSQVPAPGMFAFSSNSNVGLSNNTMNASASTPIFGQVPIQASLQNPFSIGPGGNTARRPVKTAMRRLINK